MVYTIGQSLDISEEEDRSRVWKQLLLAFVASLPFFTYGMETTVLSSSTHSGHFVSAPDDVPWSTTAFLLGSIFSAPIYCYLIDRYGRRLGIFIISLIQGASFIPLLLEDNDVNNIILHTLAGISASGLYTALPIYIREITNDKLRGVTMTLMMLLTTAGYMMKVATDVDTREYIMVGIMALQFISMYWLLETPCFLVKTGKLERAKKNLAIIICLTDEDLIIQKDINNLNNESERAKSKGDLTIIGIFKNLIWRDAIKIGIVLHTTMVFCGSILFLDEYKALSQLDTVIYPEQTLVVVCLFVGSCICLVLVRFVDRKYLLSVGYSAMVLSMGILAVYTQADLTVTSLRWLPVAALIILVISYGLVWGIPILIIVEMFNFEIRATLVGILYTYSQIMKLFHVHTIKYIEDYMGIYTMFYIFAGVNMYGAVYTLFHVPNIKNRTVRQIEKQLKRIPLLKL